MMDRAACLGRNCFAKPADILIVPSVDGPMLVTAGTIVCDEALSYRQRPLLRR
jgi:hypothetical protein